VPGADAGGAEALAGEAGQVRSSAVAGAVLGQPGAVGGEERKVGFAGRRRQGSVGVCDGERNAQGTCEGSQLLVGVDAFDAVHGVEQPVLLDRVAHQQVDRGVVHCGQWGCGQRVAVDDGVEKDRVVAPPGIGMGSADCGRGGGDQCAGCGGGRVGAEFRGDVGGDGRGGIGGEVGVGDAVEDGAVEQAAGPGHEQQHAIDPAPADWPAAVGGEVTAEELGVLAHPMQRGDLVEQAAVVGVAGQVAESFEAEPVVDRDHHQPGGRQRGAVVVGLGGGAEGVGAAVDPHQHRQAVRVGRCPDVEGEHIFGTGPPR
jgi:hypothetical protein